MPSARSFRVLVAACAAVLGGLVLAGPAAAAVPFPSENFTPNVPRHHPFVTVGGTAGNPALVLSAATRRHYPGARLDYACAILGDGIGIGAVRIGRSGTRRLAFTPGTDYCVVTITVDRTKRYPEAGHVLEITRHRHLRQTVPVSAAGRAYVACLRGTVGVLNGVQVADVQYLAAKAYPPASVLVGGTGMVALASQDTPAPVGRVGVWTDGAQHIRVSRGSVDGGQLFYDVDRSTSLVTSNVIGEIDVLAETPIIDTVTTSDRLINVPSSPG